jgi:hypothetical protein
MLLRAARRGRRRRSRATWRRCSPSATCCAPTMALPTRTCGVRLPLLHGAAPPPGPCHGPGRTAPRAHGGPALAPALGLKTDARAHSTTTTVTGVLLAFAYPDRIGRQRGGRGRFLLRNGRGASIDPRHNLGPASLWWRRMWAGTVGTAASSSARRWSRRRSSSTSRRHGNRRAHGVGRRRRAAGGAGTTRLGALVKCDPVRCGILPAEA